jgi:hypothetical protein
MTWKYHDRRTREMLSTLGYRYDRKLGHHVNPNGQQPNMKVIKKLVEREREEDARRTRIPAWLLVVTGLVVACFLVECARQLLAR